MYPRQIEVDGETVEVTEVYPLEDFFRAYGQNSSYRDAWKNQGVTNVLFVRRGGSRAIVLEYAPGQYQFQRRYTLRGDERVGRSPHAEDNML